MKDPKETILPLSECRSYLAMELKPCPADAPNAGKRYEPPQSEPGTVAPVSSDGTGLTPFERQILDRLDTLVDMLSALISLAMDERDQATDEDGVPQYDISGKRIG